MTIPPTSFLTRTIQQEPRGEEIARILAASLAAVDPACLIQEKVARKGNRLSVMGNQIDLGSTGNVYLLGIGKAALAMSLPLADLLGERLRRGFILTKSKGHRLPARYQQQLQVFSASHPVPGSDGMIASRQILDGLTSLQKNDLVIVLLSGGASALFTQPVAGISLTDLQDTNQALLGCGADIREINTIRKHLSRVKGGQLAKHLQPARILSLILSDVMGDPLDIIASGPTVPDPSTYQDALAVIDRYSLQDQLPETVIKYLAQGQKGAVPETPKPGDPCFSSVLNVVLAGNRVALEAGASRAKEEGFQTVILSQALAGEARSTGAALASKLKDTAQEIQPSLEPTCLIAGGETTVTLRDTKQPGIGGRNLELALSALPILDGLRGCLLVTLATDGDDGLSGAAGAVVSGESFQRCLQRGLDPQDYLERHDSATLFQALDDLLQTGPTGTNVNDLCFLFIQ